MQLNNIDIFENKMAQLKMLVINMLYKFRNELKLILQQLKNNI